MTAPIPIRVVMTAYDRPQYLAAAIQGILSQTFADFELVIVNDGSPNPQVADTISDCQKRDRRIIALRQKNAGAAAARNTGAAHGGRAPQYLCFADDDDISAPHRLQTQYDFLQRNPNYAAAISQYASIDARGNITATPVQQDAAVQALCASSGTLFVRAAAYRAIGGFRPWFRAVEDLDFAYRLAEKHDSALLRQNLIQCRMHGDSNLTKHSDAWRYTCAAAYAAHCRATAQKDPITDSATLNDIMRQLAAHGKQREHLQQPYRRIIASAIRTQLRKSIKRGDLATLKTLLQNHWQHIPAPARVKTRLTYEALRRAQYRALPLILTA